MGEFIAGYFFAAGKSLSGKTNMAGTKSQSLKTNDWFYSI